MLVLKHGVSIGAAEKKKNPRKLKRMLKPASSPKEHFFSDRIKCSFWAWVARMIDSLFHQHKML